MRGTSRSSGWRSRWPEKCCCLAQELTAYLQAPNLNIPAYAPIVDMRVRKLMMPKKFASIFSSHESRSPQDHV